MGSVCIGIGYKWPSPLSRYSSAKARGSRGGKPKPYYYNYDDSGRLYLEKVTGLAKILPKRNIYKRKIFICVSCGRKSVLLVRNKNDITQCPYCNPDEEMG